MKLVYERDSAISWEEMLFYKSVVSIGSLLVYKNTEFLSYLKVAKHDQTFFATRIILSVIGNMCNTYAPVYLPQAFVGAGNNIAPLLTCLFSFIFLGESLKGYYKIVILLAFIGCSVIIDGNYIKSEDQGHFKPPAPVAAWLAVGAQALQSSISAILMRKMKSVHWVT